MSDDRQQDSTAAPPSRRQALAIAAGALTVGQALAQAPAEKSGPPVALVAAPGRQRLRPPPAAETELWTFGSATPWPALRVRQGETLALRLDNRTPAPFALHWHGLRGEASQDGVGGFSQPPVAPGASAELRLTPPDPGLYLGRPLVLGGASEPAGRGLAALLVVEEPSPPPVDLDLPVLIGDWLLGDDHALAAFSGQGPAAAGPGRLGSWMTANGAPPPLRVPVAPGARVRLRLANGCLARIMRLRFDGLRAVVIAVDGQPTDIFEPVRAQLPFAPGSRYDIIFDMPREVGATAFVTALIGPGLPLLRFVSEGKARSGPVRPEPALPPNPALPAAVRLQDARRPQLVIEGGARITGDGKLDLAGLDPARPWRVNGGIGDAAGKPLFSVRRGAAVVLAIENKTAFLQPLHVHGHSFRLLHPLDDGWEPYFLDTVQIPEGKRLHIAFIADNPGRWLISSTVLDRFDLGLWTWFEVT